MRPSAMLLVVAALVLGAASGTAGATEPTPVVAPARTPQGLAVIAIGSARDDAFTLARAVYGSSLRPRSLDELRARILAGDPAPPAATKDVRELAELRASITGDDAASRRLLSSIAQQLGVQGLLVVRRVQVEDAGVESDGGAPATPPATVGLFLADSGEFDAAKYEPEAGDAGWRPTVTSLARRFPPPAAPATAQVAPMPPPKLSSEQKDSKPFYLSPWLWGAIGAAVVIGGLFWFSTQDTGEDPIHLQMRVPR